MTAEARATYFIGDVHGCLESLKRLEERIVRDAQRHGEEPFIVLLGDLVDRGPDSAGVVGYVRRGVEAGTHACVMGNHEEQFLQVIEAFRADILEDIPWSNFLWTLSERQRQAAQPGHLSEREQSMLARLMWLAQGGAATLRSYGVDPQRTETWADLPEADLRFLCGLPLVWEGDGAVATHALATPMTLSVARVAQSEVLRPGAKEACRDVMWRRKKPSTAPAEGMHVSGHTPLPRVRRRKGTRTVQIDTGCVYGGRLSAWCAKRDRVVSVKSVD